MAENIKYVLSREQIVAIFSHWTTRDIKTDRNGRIDAQKTAERFIDSGNTLFESANPPGIPTIGGE